MSADTDESGDAGRPRPVRRQRRGRGLGRAAGRSAVLCCRPRSRAADAVVSPNLQMASACRPQSCPRRSFEALAGDLPEGVVLERYRPDFPQHVAALPGFGQPGRVQHRARHSRRPRSRRGGAVRRGSARPSRACARNGSPPAAFSKCCARASCRPSGSCRRSDRAIARGPRQSRSTPAGRQTAAAIAEMIRALASCAGRRAGEFALSRTADMIRR